MSQNILILVIFSFVLGILRGTTEEFVYGYGLYRDIWAPLVESAIFVVVALIGGRLWGLEGVLLGGIVSLLIIIYGWKPFMLFKYGLNMPWRVYLLGFIKHLFCIVVGGFIFYLLHSNVSFPSPTESWVMMIVYSALVGITLFVIQFIMLYIGSKGLRNITSRFLHFK
jgi:hypothetical protein